jgi:hypothetical protein
LYSSVRKNDAVFVQLVKERVHKDGKSIDDYIILLEKNQNSLQEKLESYSYRNLFFNKNVLFFGFLSLGSLIGKSLFERWRGADVQLDIDRYSEDSLNDPTARALFVERFAAGNVVTMYLRRQFNLSTIVPDVFVIASMGAWYSMWKNIAKISFGQILEIRNDIQDKIQKGIEMLEALK